MVFHTPQRRVNYPVLKLNNVNIERVSQFNFLGVVINSTLKWDKHIAHISLKISRATGVIFRLRPVKGFFVYLASSAVYGWVDKFEKRTAC